MKQEDFEQRGWRFIYRIFKESRFQKGDVWTDGSQGAFLTVHDDDVVRITTNDDGYGQDGPHSSIKFNGKCENIDEFDLICKMIGITI